MSVELEPAELSFKRPFNHEVSNVLRISNPNRDTIAFKVKTTAPKQYCVRPNSGKIEPGQDVEVQVLLQAMKEDPPADARCKDKFLVQSVAVSNDQDSSNVSQVWANIEEAAKSSIQEKKIRVNWLPAGDAPTTNGEAPPAYSSSAASPPAETPQKGKIDDSTYGDTTENQVKGGSAVSNAAAAVTSAIPTSQDDLKRQLDAANAKITQLQQQAAETLRMRKPAQGQEKSSQATITQAAQSPAGVSVQIAALLCLISFLIAYFFF